MTQPISLAVIGATGVVGREMLSILEERKFPVRMLRLFASSRSVGSRIPFGGEELRVQELKGDAFDGIEIALFEAGGSVSRQWVPEVVKRGGVAVDLTSAHRMDPEVPLLVPEVNGDQVRKHTGILSGPNCSAAPLVMALHPLRKAFGLRRVTVTTFQSVSGAGKAAIDELNEGSRSMLDGKEGKTGIFPQPISFNCIPQIPQSDAFREEGYTDEEWKIMRETRKILGLADLPICATAVRVPVHRAHSESIQVETEKPVTVGEARELFRTAPGVELMDDPKNQVYPTPLAASGKDPVFVGRIRRDLSVENGLSLWLSCDNLRKGAALNGVQIAEKLLALRPADVK